MLILVSVTITMAVNGGLFGYAQNAARKTNNAMADEQSLGNGKIQIGDEWFDSPQDYVDKKITANKGEGPINIECSKCIGTGAMECWTCPEGCLVTEDRKDVYRVPVCCINCHWGDWGNWDQTYAIIYDLAEKITCPTCGSSDVSVRKPTAMLACPYCKTTFSEEPVWSENTCDMCDGNGSITQYPGD